MSDLDVMSFKAPKEFICKLRKKLDGQNVSQFIREAIEEKLSRNKKDEDEYSDLIKQLKKLDPLFLQKQVSDVQLTGVALFEEVKKQNEVLKLILRRATFSSMFSYQLLAKNEPVKIALHEKEAKAQINEDLTIIDL